MGPDDHPSLPFDRVEGAPSSLPVEVVRSARRRKTVQAQVSGGRMRLLIPSWMSDQEERRWVDEMRRRFERQTQSADIDLTARAATLARRHGLPAPAAIHWVDNQHHRWGSCTVTSREVRLSRRLAAFPPWVIDYVIVHELAHLLHADHSPSFHAVVDRYPLAERAKGFLIAKDLDPDDG